MGIGVDIVDLLSWLKRERHLPDRSSLMEIGAQQLANSFLRAGPAIAELGRLFGVQSAFELREPQPTYVRDVQDVADAARATDLEVCE